MPRDTERMPKVMLCTGMYSGDSQGAQGRCPERQRLHRDAQGELSRELSCYWLRLKARRKGGGQAPMGNPLLSGFLPSQVIHT